MKSVIYYSFIRLGKVVDKEKVIKEAIPAYFKPATKSIETNKDKNSIQVSLLFYIVETVAGIVNFFLSSLYSFTLYISFYVDILIYFLTSSYIKSEMLLNKIKQVSLLT